MQIWLLRAAVLRHRPLLSAGKLALLLRTLAEAALVVAPLIAFQRFGHQQFCRSTAGGSGGVPTWCAARLPYLYGYVQSHYWGVGFLRYFRFQQVHSLAACPPVPIGAPAATCPARFALLLVAERCRSRPARSQIAWLRNVFCGMLAGRNVRGSQTNECPTAPTQIPNFLLAAPILVLTVGACWQFVSDHGLRAALRAVFLPGESPSSYLYRKLC